MRPYLSTLTAALLLTAATSHAQVVSHVKVLSNNGGGGLDVSSLEAWRASTIKPNMSEKEKALAVWNSAVTFCHHSSPPHEFLNSDDNDVNDPIKLFNVYGYGLCCCQAAVVEHLGRAAGLEARGWGITGHSVAELKIDGHWSLLDASLINYFPQPDGSIASVEEMSKGINEWLDANHPDLKDAKKHDGFYAIMRKEQWKQGPAVLANNPTYDANGWLPGATHAWGDTILEYKNTAKNFVYEYGAPLGYEVNIQLRPGEKLTRNWSNKGLHVNKLETPDKQFSLLSEVPGDPKSDFRYTTKWGAPDPNTSRIGNGTLEYNPPLESLKDTALTYENLTVVDNAVPPLTAKALKATDPSKPATLIIRMPSSYIYLAGKLVYNATWGQSDSITVSFSDNNGLDWKSLRKHADLEIDGNNRYEVDLKPFIYRRYDYLVKFELNGANATLGKGLVGILFTHDIQHSQRPLPLLTEGDNTISFSTGPQEGTITAYGNVYNNSADAHGANGAEGTKNLFLNDFHPTYDNLTPKHLLPDHGKTGSLTLPISTPGDITRIRCGLHYRATNANDSWTLQASFDNGNTFTDLHTFTGPYRGMSVYAVVEGDKIPPGQKSTLLRLVANQTTELSVNDLRFDVDYKEPHATFTPVQITYQWQENGQEKSDTHLAKSPTDTYTIHCNTKPTMKSISLELAK